MEITTRSSARHYTGKRLHTIAQMIGAVCLLTKLININVFSQHWIKSPDYESLEHTLARKLESKNFVTQASVICRWKGLQQWIQKIVG